MPVAVGPRAFDVLAALVQRAGDVVTKDTLFDAVWPGASIEDNTLQVQISALRKILGRDAIATLPGRGYRFTLELTPAPAPAAIAAADAPRRHNLPRQLTSFVGRASELARLGEILADTRLLTLTGAGGCGKTRLALQLAEAAIDAFADGVWLVELASVAEPELLHQAAATALGVGERAGETLAQSIAARLAERHTLLVVDNAEHLRDACRRWLDALLQQCPNLVVLVTSREALGLTTERTHRVPSLSVPGSDHEPTPDYVGAFESTRLFIERALLQRHDFALTSENAAALAAVCRRLDGIPLALELAASRIRAMSVDEVQRRLDHVFSLLTGGSRTALPRQRTLRSLIDWSYDLLSDVEQTLLRRVSVFAGGWTPEAANHVCGGDGIARADVPALLASLCDKSLVVVERGGGAARYGLLETIRHYARDRLRDRREESGARTRQLAFFLTLAERAEPHLGGVAQQRWLEQLDLEHDNIRAALAWCCDVGGDVGAGLRLVGALWWFWYVRGYVREGREVISTLLALAEAGPVVDAGVRAKALRGAGVLAYVMSDYTAARTSYEASLVICRQLGDREGAGRVLNNLAGVASETGDRVAARRLYEEALAIQRSQPDRSITATTLGNLAIVLADDGDPIGARALFEESLAIHRELGDRQNIARALNSLAHVVSGQGDYLAARPLIDEALAIDTSLGNSSGRSFGLYNLGQLAYGQGDTETALRYLRESLALRSKLGNRHALAATLELIASVHAASSRPALAAQIWGAAERLREALGAPLSPATRRQYQTDTAAARNALGDAAFERAWSAGTSLQLAAAVQQALHADPA